MEPKVIETIGDYVFFTGSDGCLYRTSKYTARDGNGIPVSGRFEAPAHLIDQALSLHREWPGQPEPVEEDTEFKYF